MSFFAFACGAPVAASAAKPSSPGANGRAVAEDARIGAPPDHANGNGNANAGDEDQDETGAAGVGRGRTVFIAGFDGTTASHLRFANFGNAPGHVTVVLHDSETGAQLGVWTGPEIPGHGAAEVALADIGADAVPAIDPLDPFVTAEIRAGFNGHVQHLGHHGASGQTSNLTSCPRLDVPTRALGYVAGPGRTDVRGSVQLLNTGNQSAAATLHIFSAATGAELGSWQSPPLAPHAALSVAVTDLIDDATPAIAPDPAAVTMTLATPTGGLTVAYLEGTPTGAFSDLSAGCALKGGEAEEEDTDEGDNEDEEDGASQ